MDPQATAPGNAEVPSPCVRNCCLDEHDVCLGCGRSLQEILRWHDADRAERLEILDQAKRRLAELKVWRP